MTVEQYYALCVEEEDGSTEIAFFELGREALPGALGISLYASPDGELQRQQEIIAQQAVTMRQLTAASSQEPPEDAETVEEEPERAGQSATPLRERLRRAHRGRRGVPGGADC